MTSNVKDFEKAHQKKLKELSKEERIKANLNKLAQKMESDKENTEEPDGLASGKVGKDGRMIIEMDEEDDSE